MTYGLRASLLAKADDTAALTALYDELKQSPGTGPAAPRLNALVAATPGKTALRGWQPTR